MLVCFCGSQLDFTDCCHPFIVGARYPATPEQLMRSRFTAYCIQAVDYIHDTYHPTQRWQNKVADIAQFAHAAYFLDLQVHDSEGLPPPKTQIAADAQPSVEQSDPVGYVSFTARFILHDKLERIVEVSRFVQSEGRWFYLDGQLTPTPAVKIGRNDPCPCQSGQKYKICQHQVTRINPGFNLHQRRQ